MALRASDALKRAMTELVVGEQPKVRLFDGEREVSVAASGISEDGKVWVEVGPPKHIDAVSIVVDGVEQRVPVTFSEDGKVSLLNIKLTDLL